jgi:predicted nucleic acid-binding protein
VSELIVDTSVWIDFFRGRALPILEDGLREGRVLLAPIVAAELMSGIHRKSEREKMALFLRDLGFVPCDLDHWIKVGKLRQGLAKDGISISTPDAHVAQVALEHRALLYSFDRIFQKISLHVSLQLVTE